MAFDGMLAKAARCFQLAWSVIKKETPKEELQAR